MFHQLSESLAHRIRWGLGLVWLLLIASLFYDPISTWLTFPDRSFSPFRILPNSCIQVQGHCLDETPYAIGAPVFWGAIVPGAIFILLVFGHELWRRICPLSFFSQLPRALNSQRRIRTVNAKGKVRYELAKVKSDSWLARNHIYLQMGLFYLGLCSRILFVNSDRITLAFFLLGTIGCAIGVGYYYGGKSWCNYFCPMSPIQKIYAEPGGLFTSQAHVSAGTVTQSMCRTIDAQGQERSACVACQSPCLDIDSERSYWDNINAPDRKLLYYSYFGLMVGYFLYYYLYAGNWAYYMSGVWAHQDDQLTTLFDPGFYLFHVSVPIPKLVAVPLTLGLSALTSIAIGHKIEAWYRTIEERIGRPEGDTQSTTMRQHHIFTLYTYCCFNIFFIFGGRAFIGRLPLPAVYLFEGAIVALSTLWLVRTLRRTPERYARERMANRLRQQLAKLKLNANALSDRKSLDELNTDEVYVLAKVLPDFTQEKRLAAYKGMLRELLAEGYVESSRSQAMLAQMRRQLEIRDRDHQAALAEVGLDNLPLTSCGVPLRRDALMSAVGYRQALSRIRRLQNQRDSDSDSGSNSLDVRTYAITSTEQQRLEHCHNSNEGGVKRSEILLQQLVMLSQRDRILDQPALRSQSEAVALLKAALARKQRQVVSALFRQLVTIPTPSIQIGPMARALAGLAPNALQQVLSEQRPLLNHQLPTHLVSSLQRFANAAPQPNEVPPPELPYTTIVKSLKAFAQDLDPLTQAVGLYVLSTIDGRSSHQVAQQLQHRSFQLNRLVAETIETLLEQEKGRLSKCPTTFHTIEKLVCLSNNDFFKGVRSETLIELSYRARVLTYNYGDEIVGLDADRREMLLLMEGAAQIETVGDGGGMEVKQLVCGEPIDELEVAGQSAHPGTITATVPETRILAIPVDEFDDLMDADWNFARKVAEMESHRLHQLLGCS
ncbi:MAG: cyclic nucleotide-binding protein [Cyanobacteria bacterium P01_E01_bin.34]